MKNFVIKGGRILSPKDGFNYDKLDIFIEDGKIKDIDKNICKENSKVLNLNNEIVTPGFIDIHTHCYRGKSPIGTEPDIIGVQRGSTSIFDAGTSGPLNYMDFKSKMDRSKTHIYTLLNISDWGLNTLNELSNLDNIHEDKIIEAVSNNRNNIVGIKARASASVVGKNGIVPIKMAKKIAHKLRLPLVVHIGHFPPHIEEVLNVLGKDDIITHSFHGKSNGLFNDNNLLKQSVLDARKRGVRFDVGHGSESFSFKRCEGAIKNSFKPDFISTDLYYKNMVEPVGSLLNVVTKMISCGLSIEECISKVTYDVAQFFNLKNKGKIKLGYNGDFTIFNIEDCSEVFKDSYGSEKVINKRLKLKDVVVSGGNESDLLEFN